MRMRKFSFVFLLFVLFSISGCQNTSDSLISFNTFNHPIGYDSINQIVEEDFFAKDLIIVADEEKHDSSIISAEAGMIFNITDKEAIYHKNLYEKFYPASLTKLLTALVAIKHGELDDLVTISFEAANISEPGAQLCGFEEGDIISLGELLYSLLIYSGNDAAISIAEHIGGSVDEFNIMMNKEAKSLGAVHSNFTNAHGLHDEEHYTTLYDMYLIFNEFIKYDFLMEIVKSSQYTAKYHDKEGTAKEISMNSTNQYFMDEIEPEEGFIVEGGKTGYTFKAGNCLIMLSKDEDEKHYISGILKASDRSILYSEMNKLLSLVEIE